MADSAILARIKKLLSLATSDNENEAAEAAQKAQDLLIKYNISDSELNDFADPSHENVIDIVVNNTAGHNRTVWKDRLTWRVAEANLCKVIVNGAGNGYIWIGKPTNIEVGQFVAESLTRDLERLCKINWILYLRDLIEQKKERGFAQKASKKTWANSFYFGAVQSIADRLNSGLLTLKAAPAVNALVRANDIEIEQYEKEKYPDTYTIRRQFNKERTAFERGKSAGREVEFKTGIGAGGKHSTKLLGSGR